MTNCPLTILLNNKEQRASVFRLARDVGRPTGDVIWDALNLYSWAWGQHTLGLELAVVGRRGEVVQLCPHEFPPCE